MCGETKGKFQIPFETSDFSQKVSQFLNSYTIQGIFELPFEITFFPILIRRAKLFKNNGAETALIFTLVPFGHFKRLFAEEQLASHLHSQRGG